MTDVANVFYWATQLCLEADQATVYTNEDSAWKTQSNKYYFYVRDAIILNNVKNQGLFNNKATETANWEKFTGMITGNNKDATVTADLLGAGDASHTAKASFVIG